MKNKILKAIGMFMVIGALISSCVGEQGEPGPVGGQGDKGDAGNDGGDGNDGIDGVAKSGFFEGTISGKRTDGVAFTYDFKFDRRPNDVLEEENYQGLLGSNTEGFVYDDYCDCHQLMIIRQDSAFGGNTPSELRLRLILENMGTENEKLSFDYQFFEGFKIFFLKELSATSIFRVEAKGFGYSDTVEITNFHHDSNTGRLTFEFDTIIKADLGIYNNSTKHDLNIKGKFDSDKGKVYKDVISRKIN